MGNSPNLSGFQGASGPAPVHAFYSPRSWIEGAAVRQLESVAAMPGVKAVAALPDLHPGKYGPVGCSVLAEHIHPQLVGSDIGCGMGLFQLDIPARKLRLDRLAERLRALEGPWDGDASSVLAEAGLPSALYASALGSVGGGNHFCEVQAVEEIIEPDIAARAGLDRALACVLAHSGSRGLGYAILQRQMEAGAGPLARESEAGRAYLAEHDDAVRWAVLNRRVIATRAAEAARAELRPIADLGHNLAESGPEGVLHRKGAAPADRGLVPLPGSRGALSYLVEPLAGSRPETLASIAHGAGRKYDRASMHGRSGATKSDRERLARNPFGGLVVCEDRELLIEEAPEAYKNVDRVVADLVEFGLARVVATLRPLVTFKTANKTDRTVGGGRRQDAGGRGDREDRR
jgi:release factor H-coupled RctB family protein